jgi:hypothetical protein
MEISWNVSSHLIAMYKPETSWPSSFSIISLVEDSNILADVRELSQAEPTQPPAQCFLTSSQENSTSMNQSFVETQSQDGFCVLQDSQQCKVCIPGFTFQNRKCTACPGGTYKGGYGTNACVACEAGWSTLGLNGQAYCWPCSQGTSTMGLTGQSECTTCPLNSEARVKGMKWCTCVPGTSLDYSGNYCVPCEAGYRDNYDPNIRDVAGSGTISPKLYCVPCLPGTFSPKEGAIICISCAQGTFAQSLGQSTCEKCPINTTSMEGGIECKACPEGSYTLSDGSSVCLCLAGTFVSFNNQCEKCQEGTYQPYNDKGNSNLVCLKCEPGTYNPNKGSALCIECPIGKYQDQWGSTTCTQCGPYSSTLLPSATSSNHCKCIAGSAKDAGGCVPCPPSYYQNLVHQEVCLSCPKYYTTTKSGSTICNVCLAGAKTIINYYDEVVCEPCSLGQYQPMSQQMRCLPCPSGSFSDIHGATSCSLCSENTFSSVDGSDQCLPCPLHTDTAEKSGSISCGCVLGYANSFKAIDDCLPCLPGYFQDKRGENCQACPAGTYSMMPGGSSCMTCFPGSFTPSSGLSTCKLCPINTTTPPFTKCTKCENGSYTRFEGSVVCLCSAGTLPSEGKCELCESGKYQPYNEDENKSLECSSCQPGFYNPAQGSSSCIGCPIGKYQDQWGSTICIQCGSYSNTTLTSATSPNYCKCVAGTTRDAFGVSCVPCPPSYYQNLADQEDCLICPKYYTTTEYGSTICNVCLAGAIKVNQKCVPCRPGYFQPNSQQSQCLQCPAGTFAELEGSTSCTLCTINSFASIDGSSGCLPCPTYTETSGISGSTRCSCSMGYAISIEDTCLPCIPGFFQLEKGGPCRACAAGTYTPDYGSSGPFACLLCDLGMFASAAGLSSCNSCPVNSEALTRGSKSCTCIPGTGMESGYCVPCVAGYYQPASLPNCLACLPGFFSNQTQSSTCLQCAQGMYSENKGSINCLECKGGAVTSLNQTKCTCVESQTFNQTTSASGWKCSQCTPSCTYNETFMIQACNANQDTVCQACKKECPTGKYITASCTTTKDITCKSCSVGCAVGSYMSIPCSKYSNMVCSPCTTKCPSNRYVVANVCTFSKDLTCVLCPPGTFAKDSGGCIQCPPGFITSNSTQGCTQCAKGMYSDASQTLCVGRCLPDTYPSSRVSCSACPLYTSGDGSGCVGTATNLPTQNICKPDFVLKI